MNAVTHLEKVITGEVSAVTHLEKVIAGETSAVTYTEKVITGKASPVTHLQKVIAGVESPVTHLEYIWAGGSPTPTEHEYTGVVPYSFNADGSPLLDWYIKGNTVQSTTPTPQNPITPEGCGDLETVGAKAGQYKIPISSANTTTPVYLGEVESTRRIYKLVLTGRESWNANSTGNTQFFFTTVSNEAILNSEIICTHFENANIGQTTTVVGIGFAGTVQLRVRPENTSAETVISFKQWLIDQYAAGTPVTIWYVLAEPETGIVNEPLMKIGEYADTLSMEQAGVSIPTNNGSTTVDVETTLKPSEVYIKYKGV